MQAYVTYLGPRQRWSWKEKAVPGTNIEWLMTEGNLAPTTEGVGILGHANHIKAQSVGLTVGKSCWCLDLTCTTCAVWQASSRHSWFLTVGPLSQGLIINMPEIRPPFFFFSSMCSFFKRHLPLTGALPLIPFHIINLALVPGAATYDT